ncbi:MAG: pyridoxal-phosphate dependent enzyme [Stygiobacter sp.]
MNKILTKERLIEARERISNQVKRTPILTSSSINKILNANIFFKCENFQKVGAFKFRGASNAVLSLNEIEMINGVATHSSGNHAAALALAAKMKNIPAYIVMPITAPEIKKKAVAGYGAKIIFCDPTLKAREETLNNIINKTNAVFIHSYDNYDVIAGQSTAAQEIFDELNDLDFIIAPVGGGGLLSGTALSTKYFSPKTKIIGAEPKEADDAFKSFNDKIIYPSISPKTICDGLLTQLSEKTFKIITNTVDEILTAKEETIIEAMKLIWERMKIIIEPSSAVAVAIMIENQEKFLNKKIAIILSGGNVDLKNLPFK